MASLIVTKGPAEGQKFGLEGHSLVMVGRDASCTIQVIDPQLSRFHLQVKYVAEEKKHYVLDFQSKNGVMLNDKKIESASPLKDHDAISAGETTLLYVTDDSLDARHVCDVMKRFGQGHVHTVTHD